MKKRAASKRTTRGYVRNKFINVVKEVIDEDRIKNKSLVEYYEKMAVQHFDRLYDKLRAQEDQINALLEGQRVIHENIAWSRNTLAEVRKSKEYKSVFENNAPLISVRIATWNRSKLLKERAIASVLRQTYQNFEIIIVGDHCTDDTEEMIQKLHDPRIKFYNLPHQSIYPKDRIKKWQVIGALPMNTAANMASGEWIAPLDDDDEFTPDHLEVLLKNALQTKAEVSYGGLTRYNLVDKSKDRIYSSTPEYGAYSFVGAIYMRVLNEIFQYDQHSWISGEPADWNMCRRMMESGVRITSIDKDVGIINMIPAGHDAKNY